MFSVIIFVSVLSLTCMKVMQIFERKYMRGEMKINYMLMFILVILTIGCASNTDNKKLKKVDFILDWVPNTNHTVFM